MSYTRLEYLQTNKTFFTTNATLTQNCAAQFECAIESIKSGSDNLIFGLRENSVTSSKNIVVNVAAGRSQWTYYCAGKYNDYCGAYTLSHKYSVEINKTQFKYTDLDSNTGNTYTYSGSYSADSNRYIRIGGCFNYSTNSIDQNNADVKWYEVRIYENTTLVHQYLPYKDNDTNYGVLYDVVTDTYISANNPSNVICGPNYTNFSIDVDELSFGNTSSSSTVELTSDNPWTASTNDSWVSLSDYSGTTGQSITVSVEANNLSWLIRTGTVTFTSGENTLDLVITQSGVSTVILKNLYRNGSKIKMMFRNGVKIYQMFEQGEV